MLFEERQGANVYLYRLLSAFTTVFSYIDTAYGPATGLPRRTYARQYLSFGEQCEIISELNESNLFTIEILYVHLCYHIRKGKLCE